MALRSALAAAALAATALLSAPASRGGEGPAAAPAAAPAATPAPTAESSVKGTARKLVERHKDAVVLVEAVVKMKLSAGGRSQEREQKMEVNGTVISPDGLTVVSNGSIDPTAAFTRRGGKADVTTSDVKIVAADGTEYEAQVVRTDSDLDLAFIRPKNEVQFPCLELKKGPEPALLDTLVSITRLGRKAGREPGVALSEVLSVIRKPRLRYVTSGQIFLGCPVFNANGDVLGLALVQTDGAVNVSVLPCEDILEVAKQAGRKKDADKEDKGKDQDKDKEDPKPKTDEQNPAPEEKKADPPAAFE
jgi:S1-C subfamily serine protease